MAWAMLAGRDRSKAACGQRVKARQRQGGVDPYRLVEHLPGCLGALLRGCRHFRSSLQNSTHIQSWIASSAESAEPSASVGRLPSAPRGLWDAVDSGQQIGGLDVVGGEEPQVGDLVGGPADAATPARS